MATRPLPDRFQVAFSLAGEQRNLVRAVAQAVEAELGSGTVFLDEWFEYYIAGSDADLKLQRIYGERCDLVVVCVSGQYGGKPWTLAEYEAVRARHLQARTSVDGRDPDRILPIRVGDGDVAGILFNAIVPDIRNGTVEQAAKLIIDRLRYLAPTVAGAPGPVAADAWLAEPPALSWPMADHSGVREAFATLLTQRAAWRFLPVRGVSETGKSHITRQMLANVLAMPPLACGRFDFKGGTDMDAEVRAFVPELGVPVPPPSALLNERLSHILDTLFATRRPTVLIFDTYEDATQPQQDWVEKQLLLRLVRAPWLRVVVAGQRVPESVGAIWQAVAHGTIELTPPPPADWFDFGRRHRPDLTLEDVETACRLARNKAGLLAQLFSAAG